MSVLARILAEKMSELASVAERLARAAETRESQSAPRSVVDVLRRMPDGAPLRLIAEVKFKSPSAGPLSTTLSAPSRAAAYARAGATMVSVLCDGPFFGGSWDDLAEVRARLDADGLSARLLAKEFIVDARQLALARKTGADAALLIARILQGAQLSELVSAARSFGLEPLVEVVDEAELTAALDADAHVIGVNARDLDTLQMDVRRAARVLAGIPPDRVALHLSGVKTPDAVAHVAAGRADGALIGEALMREDDPTPLLERFVAATRGEFRQGFSGS
jgi:indole-3-glycerol phosphate synthase